MTHQEYESRITLPVYYGVIWDEALAPSLPDRKALAVNLLNRIEGLARAHGATGVRVEEIEDAPDGNAKLVTLGVSGEVDLEALQASLRSAWRLAWQAT